MTTYEALLELDWPQRLIVQYKDGTKEQLLRDAGVHIADPRDEASEIGALRKVVASFSAVIPPKHEANQKKIARVISFDDLDCIQDENGTTILNAENFER